MILRPSKIFVSLHQLRQYFQTKVSELVVTTHQQVTQVTNYSATQQSIIFFSDIQLSLIQQSHYLQQPMKRTPINNKLLLNVIQRHFPIAKVFSQPTIHGRSVMWAANQPSQQLRTMMSSSGSGGTSFLTYGLPRSAMVGLGRNSGFSPIRQFSTTRTPCVTFFQNTQQPNVLAHISSRVFSPAGTKMSQPITNDEKPKYVPFFSSEKDLSSSEEDDEESIYSKHHSTHVFSHQTNKGIADLVYTQAEETKKQLYVKRETVGTKYAKRKLSKKLDSIIRHDDISSLHGRMQTKRRLSSGNITTRNCRTKHPPDRRVIKTQATSIYLLIQLSSIPFTPSWTTESLNGNFIDSLEYMVKSYQLHIYHVLNLLDRLRFSGKEFRVVSRNSELRIYFPSCANLNTELDAIEYLKRLQVDEEEEYFSIIVETSSIVHDFNLNSSVSTNYFKDLQTFLDHTDYLINTSKSVFSH